VRAVWQRIDSLHDLVEGIADRLGALDRPNDAKVSSKQLRVAANGLRRWCDGSPADGVTYWRSIADVLDSAGYAGSAFGLRCWVGGDVVEDRHRLSWRYLADSLDTRADDLAALGR